MFKEIIISILALIAIIIGNITTQNYIETSVKEISESLENIRGELYKEEIDYKNVKEKIAQIEANWNGTANTLSYFLEHDELEKVYTELTAARSFVDTEEYEQGICEIDKALYTLGHIKNKTALELKNIF